MWNEETRVFADAGRPRGSKIPPVAGNSPPGGRCLACHQVYRALPPGRKKRHVACTKKPTTVTKDMPPRNAVAPAGEGTRLPDFSEAPFLVLWELTRACDLVCRHCRAEAIPQRDPNELSSGEASRLLEEISGFGRPLVVLTGGDPMRRPDVFELVERGRELGLRMTMTPSATPAMTRPAIARLARAGLSRVAVSIDAASAAVHDGFRGVDGSFEWSRSILEHARAEGLSTQINTTVSRHNYDSIDDVCRLVGQLGVDLWSVFFLVPTGRASLADGLSAGQHERVFERMFRFAEESGMDVKSTAAPQYRRYLLQQRKTESAVDGSGGDAPGRWPRVVGAAVGSGGMRAMASVNDGNGVVFVSHTGEVFPSGFLPVAAGNVRDDSLGRIYRESPLFRGLRDYGTLRGKCGLCDFRDVCGGSRARSLAMTGDLMESDPFCAYVPPAYRELVRSGEAESVSRYFGTRVHRHLGECGTRVLAID